MAGRAPVLALDIKSGDYGTPGVSIVVACAVSTGLLLIAEATFSHLPASASRAATLLAGPGLVVVLLHPVVLWLLDAPHVGDVGIFVLALVAPWTIGLLLVRTPLAPWAAGVPAPRPGRTAAAAR